MQHVSEMLFVDPSVDDIETIISGLRTEVRAIVLDRATPAARQIAGALEGAHDLEAVHIIAHGAPGRVNFSAGNWSAATLLGDAPDLAAIGRALRVGGEVRLWSCDSALGVVGASFIAAVAELMGVDVTAATTPIGAAARGGSWNLTTIQNRAPANPPLTTAAMERYTGVMRTLTSNGMGHPVKVYGNWPTNTAAGTYFVVWNDNGTLKVLGRFIVPTGNLAGTFAVSAALPAGSYSVDPSRAGPGCIAVYDGRWSDDSQDGRSWSIGNLNSSLTATLNDPQNVTSPRPTYSGAIR
jgi:hypothetical protein